MYSLLMLPNRKANHRESRSFQITVFYYVLSPFRIERILSLPEVFPNSKLQCETPFCIVICLDKVLRCATRALLQSIAVRTIPIFRMGQLTLKSPWREYSRHFQTEQNTLSDADIRGETMP